MELIDLDAVRERLSSFGFETEGSDEWTLQFCAEKVVEALKAETNQSDLPHALYAIAVDRTCGEFLAGVQMFAPARFAGLDLVGAVKQLSEGDTSITFCDSADPGAQLSAFIAMLRSAGTDLILRYRRLVW